MMVSNMQPKLELLMICYIQEANKYIYDVMNFRPCIRFIRPIGTCNIERISMSDVTHSESDSLYRHTRNFPGLRIHSMGEQNRTYRIIYLTPHQQKSATQSMFRTAILAASDSYGRELDINTPPGRYF